MRVVMLAGLLTVAAVPAWLWIYTAGIAEVAGLPALTWHAHEMVFGFAFAAIAGFVDDRMELEDLVIRAATPGRDAVGEVTVRLRVGGRSFTGRGASTDVVNAAARACIHGLNKAAQATHLEARELARAADVWGV